MGVYEYINIPADSAEASLKKIVGSRSWILVDCNGKASVLDVDKYAIMERFQINTRDLRILDPLLSSSSTILAREKAILLNLEHIKAIITANEVLLQDTLHDDINPIVEEIRRQLPISSFVHQESPFEIRVLKVALEAICSFLEASTTELETETYPALDDLTSKISSKHLDQVRKLKSEIASLTARVQKVKDLLEQLMNDDDYMADLYLSKIPKAIRGNVAITFHEDENEDENDVEELETLLETYFMQIDESLTKLTTLRGYIGDTEDFINIQLENRRNQIIGVELFVASSLFCLNVYSMVIQFFNSNIPFPWNNGYPAMFTWVCILPGILAILLLVAMISYFHKKGLMGS